MHISNALQLLNEYNFLEKLSQEEKKIFKDLCIKLVIATDMAQHSKSLEQAEILMLENKTKDGYNWNKIFEGKNKEICMEMLIHCCDVSNPLKSVDLSQNWGIRCIAEFMIQGDMEKKLKYPIIPELFDRDIVNFHKSQVGFIQFVVLPL